MGLHVARGDEALQVAEDFYQDFVYLCVEAGSLCDVSEQIVNFVESAQNFLKLLFRHLVPFILFIQSVGNLSHSPRLILKFLRLGIEILNDLIGRPKDLLKDMFLGS